MRVRQGGVKGVQSSLFNIRVNLNLQLPNHDRPTWAGDNTKPPLGNGCHHQNPWGKGEVQVINNGHPSGGGGVRALLFNLITWWLEPSVTPVPADARPLSNAHQFI